jgi:hypothetical protein
MRQIICVVIGFLAMVCAFAAGLWWRDSQIGRLNKFNLSKNLTIQASPGKEGVIPVGAVFYEYRVLPETTTYILFVNLKERDILQQHRSVIEGSVEPIDAHPADVQK